MLACNVFSNMSENMMRRLIFFVFIYILSTCAQQLTLPKIPESAVDWIELPSPGNVKFTARNAHATTVFRGEIWLTGGRTDEYTTYDLLTSHRVADVWHSPDGQSWTQISKLYGDYYAQNFDAMQPGPVAPFYARYGHTMNAIDSDGDGEDDMLLLCGGYAPEPMNDVWISEDGITWVFAGYAPWEKRAWHSATIFNNTLWIGGGSPLNNDLWYLKSIRRENRVEPLTRSMYVNYTFILDWGQAEAPAYSPRLGFGMISHWYFNASEGQNYTDAVERLVVAGGYGGWLDEERFDGIRGRQDVWVSADPIAGNWTLITDEVVFGERAWFAFGVLHGDDPRHDIISQNNPGRVYVFGGGNIGSKTSSTAVIRTMDGKLDGYWSRDMVNWIKLSYEEGGGQDAEIQKLYASKNVPLYSSQAWALTEVNSEPAYLGKWGMTMVSFNKTSGKEHPGSLVLIGGDYTGVGARTANTYESQSGLFCNIEGVPCFYRGTCTPGGCVCNEFFEGENCEISLLTAGASGLRDAWIISLIFTAAVSVFMSVFMR